MSKLFRTDKPDLDAMIAQAQQGPSPDAVAIVNNLGRLLAGISNQLDLLIKLECNFIKRRDLHEQLLAAQAEANLMAEVAEAQTDEGAPLEEVEE